MALHNLKIVVVDGGRSASYKSNNTGISNSVEGKQNYKDTPLYKVLNAKQTIKNKVQSGMSPSSVYAMNMGTQVSGQLIRQTANYYVSDIGRRFGDNNYQQRINRQIEVATDSLSVVNGLVSGAATGSMFGPIGAAIGAVAGVVSSGVSLGFKYAERERSYQWERFQQNTNQAYNLSRANYSIFTGRLR